MPKTQDFWVFILSPGDLDSRRHMGPRLAAQGTLTHSAGDLDSRRQGTTYSAPLPCKEAPPGGFLTCEIVPISLGNLVNLQQYESSPSIKEPSQELRMKSLFGGKFFLL